jgi:hypothetical protein
MDSLLSRTQQPLNSTLDEIRLPAQPRSRRPRKDSASGELAGQIAVPDRILASGKILAPGKIPATLRELPLRGRSNAATPEELR